VRDGHRGAQGRVKRLARRILLCRTLRPAPITPQTAPAALEDLRAWLGATRWPDQPEDAGWSLGTDLATSASSSPTGTGSTGRRGRRRSPGSRTSASRSAASGSTRGNLDRHGVLFLTAYVAGV
jgi:hypothetical protein